MDKVLINSFFLNEFLEKWNTNNDTSTISEGYSYLATFEVYMANYFRINFVSYTSDMLEIVYNNTWSKIKPILIANVDNNNNNSLTLSGNLTVVGTTSSENIQGVILSKISNGYMWLGGPFKGLLIQWGINLCSNYDRTNNNIYYKNTSTNITANSDYLYGHTNYSSTSNFKKTIFHCGGQTISLGWESDTSSNMSVRWIMLSF